MSEQPKDVIFTYDEVAQHLFESLVEMGYAPAEDEILDITDIVMDLILHFHLMMGGEVEMMVIEEDFEEDED
jgi:hypothetical protein